jgi:hypothetical protein
VLAGAYRRLWGCDVPAPKFVNRFQVYVLTIGTLDAGQLVEGLPLPLDSDAPFWLWGRGGRCSNVVAGAGGLMLGLSTRFQNAGGRYLQDVLVPWPLDVPGGGRGGAWKSVWPWLGYPAGSVIAVDAFNGGADSIENLQLYFVGVKQFPAGTPFTTYPPSISVLDFCYSHYCLDPVTGQPGAIGGLLAVNGPPRLNIPLNVASDADFAFRYGQAGVDGTFESPNFYSEVFIELLDGNHKPYMNAPVHLDWLFGNSLRVPGIDLNWAGYPNQESYLVGNFHPGLIVPEIYLPANGAMYYNLYRNDSAYADAQPINLNIAFRGSKVFRRG